MCWFIHLGRLDPTFTFQSPPKKGLKGVNVWFRGPKWTNQQIKINILSVPKSGRLPINNMHEDPPKIIAENSICDPYRPTFSRLMPILPKKSRKKWK